MVGKVKVVAVLWRAGTSGATVKQKALGKKKACLCHIQKLIRPAQTRPRRFIKEDISETYKLGCHVKRRPKRSESRVANKEFHKASVRKIYQEQMPRLMNRKRGGLPPVKRENGKLEEGLGLLTEAYIFRLGGRGTSENSLGQEELDEGGRREQVRPRRENFFLAPQD